MRKKSLLNEVLLFKILDRGKQIVDLALNLGLAYLGAKHFKHPVGALFGPIALKLARSENVVAGTSGVIGLVSLGVAVGGVELKMPNMSSWDAFVKKERERAKEHPFGAVRVG